MANTFKAQVDIVGNEGVSQVLNTVSHKFANVFDGIARRTNGVMNGMSESVGSKLQQLANTTKGLWGPSGVLGAVGGALAIGGTAHAMGQFAEQVAQLKGMAGSIGMPVEQFQQWRFAAQQAGVEAGMLTNGLARLGETAFQVAQGGAKEQAKLFQAMHVAVRDQQGNVRGISDVAMDVAERFREHIQRIDQLRKQGNFALAGQLEAETNNAAQQMFGMKAREVAGLLAQGREGLQRAFDDANRTGGVFGEEQVEKIESYAKAMNKLQFAKQGLVAGLFADKMQVMANKMAGLAMKIGEFTRKHPAIMKTVSSALVLAAGLTSVATAAKLAGMAFRFIGVANPWMLALAAAAALVYANWEKIEPVLEGVSEWLQQVWQMAQPVIEQFGSDVWTVFAGTLSDIKQTFTDITGAVSGLASEIPGASEKMGGLTSKFQAAADIANGLRVIVDLLTIAVETLAAPFRLLAVFVEATSDKWGQLRSSWEKGGALGLVRHFNDPKQDFSADLWNRWMQNFGPSGQRMGAAFTDLYDEESHPATAESMQAGARFAADQATPYRFTANTPALAGNYNIPYSPGVGYQPAALASAPTATDWKSKPQEVTLKTDGKIGIDVRVALDRALLEQQTGVDQSGAPAVVGDVGVSTVHAA
ncbi:hypothetical protein [Paraburkholderia tuberum]|uniref:Phage tail tape measure protein, TP901 family, core region n=1 Tax=Paraburkholderia tuberum TaxID=157910 RepID=A0A1H1JTG9_9BURK|nr:hypothetical protein [Paraburkholderia tuberum]SDR52925.1 hypothetical protein SAMN05445850_5574 [Paraburkholderia tuberum]